jgi:hypothetical protein
MEDEDEDEQRSFIESSRRSVDCSVIVVVAP